MRRSRHIATATMACALCALCLGCRPAEDASTTTSASSPAPASEAVNPSDQAAPLRTFEEPTSRQEELFARAVDALQHGDEDDAILALLTLGETGSRSEIRATGLLALSELYFQSNRIEASIDVLQDVRATSPSSPDLEYVLAAAFMRADRPMEAEDAYRRAIRLSADHLRSYVALASLLARNGRHEDADEVMLAFERHVYRIGDRIASASDPVDRVAAVSLLNIGFHDARLTRAALRALPHDDVRVQLVVAETLRDVGTIEALGPLRSLHGLATEPTVGDLIDDAIQAIESRQAANPDPTDRPPPRRRR